MSKITEQLDRIEAILNLHMVSDMPSHLSEELGTDFRCLMTKLEKIEKLIDSYISYDSDDDCTICGLEEALKEKEEELTAQEEIIDNNIGYIDFLENELTIRTEENRKLRKKNKKLKKKIKELTCED